MDTLADAVQGDCAAKPGPAMSKVTGADLRPLLPRQCLLVTDARLLTVTNSSLWMDNLYIRLERSTRTPPEPVLLAADTESPGLYLTGITLQVPPPPAFPLQCAPVSAVSSAPACPCHQTAGPVTLADAADSW